MSIVPARTTYPCPAWGLSFDDAHRGLRRVNAGILRPNKRSPGVFRWITAVVWLRRAAVPMMSTVVSRKCASRVLFGPARSSVLLWKTPVLLKRFMVRRPRKLWCISSPRMVEPKKTPSGSRTAAAFLNTRNENSHVRHKATRGQHEGDTGREFALLRAHYARPARISRSGLGNPVQFAVGFHHRVPWKSLPRFSLRCAWHDHA